MMKKLIICFFLILSGLSVFASGSYESAVYTDDSNLAVEGWDAVSFFEGNSPKEGDALWETEYKQAIWRFSSEKNLNLFNAAPGKYAPAYGGYCAWAMSEGNLAPGRAEHWDIIDGRLYLNFSRSTRNKFLSDTGSMIENADRRWPDIEKGLESKE